MKRLNYITWDEYFISIALLASMRSKDPVTQVGACIVDKENRIISQGYNGFPVGISDDEFPWDKNPDDLYNDKHFYVVHAELNAILGAPRDLNGCRLYTTLFPCPECAKAIIQSRISDIIYIDKKPCERDSVRASERMLKASGIKMRQIKGIELEIKR